MTSAIVRVVPAVGANVIFSLPCRKTPEPSASPTRRAVGPFPGRDAAALERAADHGQRRAALHENVAARAEAAAARAKFGGVGARAAAAAEASGAGIPVERESPPPPPPKSSGAASAGSSHPGAAAAAAEPSRPAGGVALGGVGLGDGVRHFIATAAPATAKAAGAAEDGSIADVKGAGDAAERPPPPPPSEPMRSVVPDEVSTDWSKD